MFVSAAGQRVESIFPNELSDADIKDVFLAVYGSWKQYSADVVKAMHAYRATVEVVAMLGPENEKRAQEVLPCLDFLIENAARVHERVFSEMGSDS